MFLSLTSTAPVDGSPPSVIQVNPRNITTIYIDSDGDTGISLVNGGSIYVKETPEMIMNELRALNG